MMFKKIEKFVTGLGVWNHAFLSLFILPIVGLIFGGAWFKAAFTVCFGYYFREHAHSNKYNPFKWKQHDYIQSALLILTTIIEATILTAVT